MPVPDPLSLRAPTAVATSPAGHRRIDLLYTGSTHLWHLHYTEGSGWSQSWRKRGGPYRSSVVACAFSGGRIDAFGLRADGDLHHAWGTAAQLDEGGIWPSESLGRPDGRTIVSSPTAVMTSPTGLIAAVRTTRDSDGEPGIWFVELESTGLPGGATWRWHRYLTGQWPAAKREFASGLGMTWRRPGSYDLAVIGTDGHLQHTLSEGKWEKFAAPRDGGLTSTPCLTYWHEPADPCVHIATCFGPSELEPGAVALKSWLGRHWGEQQLIYVDGVTDGRGVASPPAITSWGKPRLDVFFLSAADQVGSDIGLTHGYTERPAAWGWEVLPAPPL